jgi:hypothetical protein
MSHARHGYEGKGFCPVCDDEKAARPDKPSDGAVARAFWEFGDRKARSEPATATGAYVWIWRRARELDAATTRDTQADSGELCSDCPPVGDGDKMRCTPCPRRLTRTAEPTVNDLLNEDYAAAAEREKDSG